MPGMDTFDGDWNVEFELRSGDIPIAGGLGLIDIKTAVLSSEGLRGSGKTAPGATVCILTGDLADGEDEVLSDHFSKGNPSDMNIQLWSTDGEFKWRGIVKLDGSRISVFVRNRRDLAVPKFVAAPSNEN